MDGKTCHECKKHTQCNQFCAMFTYNDSSNDTQDIIHRQVVHIGIDTQSYMLFAFGYVWRTTLVQCQLRIIPSNTYFFLDSNKLKLNLLFLFSRNLIIKIFLIFYSLNSNNRSVIIQCSHQHLFSRNKCMERYTHHWIGLDSNRQQNKE